MEYRFSWRDAKAEKNLRKHHVDFEKAKLVFFDPLHLSRQDRHEDGEERWQTLGMVDGQAVLLVAHTLQEDEIIHIHIVSARKATKHERKFYENRSR